jgi:hypothetical protein
MTCAGLIDNTGLQLNNPLTSRPSVGSDTSRQRSSSYEHLAAQLHKQSYSPIITNEAFFGTSDSRGGGGHAAGSQQSQQQEQQQEPDATWLEKFEFAGNSWVVYESEGYPYYFVEATQHSQWEDPRQHGVLRYNEATGEYVAEDLPTLPDVQRDSPKGRSLAHGGAGVRDGDLPEVESHYRSPGRKRSQTRGQTSKPRRITADAEDVSPDGKDGRFWSGSEEDDSLEEVPSVDNRRRARGGKASSAGGRRKGGGEGRSHRDDGEDVDLDAEDLPEAKRGSTRGRRQPQRRKQYSDDDSQSPQEFDDDREAEMEDLDINMAGMERRHGPGSASKKVSRGGPGGRGGGGNEDPLSADDVDSMQFGSDIRKLKDSAKTSRVSQGGAFADADDPQFLLDGPEEASEAVDGYDDDSDGMKKINCFSPDKASLDRALQLQRSFSPKALLGSPSNSNSDSDSDHGKSKKSPSSKRGNKASRKPAAFSDEEEMDYSRPRRRKGKGKERETNTSTAYSDEDEEGDEGANDSGEDDNESDWDAESEIDEKGRPTRTGNLGSIEHNIKSQSTKNKKPDKSSKPAKPRPPENLDEDKLKKGKLFVAERGGYGNGGNTFDIAPLESDDKPVPKSAFPSLKPGGSGGFVSPRPLSQPQLDDAEMEARIQPYIEMLRQGVPCLSVKNSMAKAGESRETIKLMLERADDLSISSNLEIMRASSGGAGPAEAKSDKLSKEELAALKQDPEIGKYMKMHGMGVPAANIVQKMELDQLSGEAIARVKGYMGIKTEEEGAGQRGDLRESMRRKSSVPMLKMHWNALPPEKLQNSIFAGGKDEDSMQDEELEELEKLFGAQSKPEAEAVQVVDKRMRLLVLDGKRAQNVVIGLAQFKAFESHDMLLSAVCAMDEAGGLLSGDRLQNLSQLIPSVPESRKIHGMEGSEHPAELFFMVANKYFPDLPKRLACFVTCCTFEESFTGVMAKMKKIIDACNEVSDFRRSCSVDK